MNNIGVRETEVVVAGAGQAGLAAAFHLRRAGYEPDRDFVVLDHAPRPGGAWPFRWPTLTYGKVHGMHALPGMELTGADPDRPSSKVIGAYFGTYERTFGLRVHRPVDVRTVRDGADGPLLLETSEGTYATRALVNATGTWDRPFWPRFPGQEVFTRRPGPPPHVQPHHRNRRLPAGRRTRRRRDQNRRRRHPLRHRLPPHPGPPGPAPTERAPAAGTVTSAHLRGGGGQDA